MKLDKYFLDALKPKAKFAGLLIGGMTIMGSLMYASIYFRAPWLGIALWFPIWIVWEIIEASKEADRNRNNH